MQEILKLLYDHWLIIIPIILAFLAIILLLIRKGYLKKLEIFGSKWEFSQPVKKNMKNSDSSSTNTISKTKMIDNNDSADDLDNHVSKIDPNRVKIVIENIEQLYGTRFTEAWLIRRIENFFRVHYELFEDNKGFFATFSIDSDFSGVLSLNGDSLRLHFMYKYPNTEQEIAWEKLYEDHIEMLNSIWRRDERMRFREESYKHYIEKLRKHISLTNQYINEFRPTKNAIRRIQKIRHTFSEANLEIEESITKSLVTSEKILQELHILILEVIKPDEL